MKKRLLRLGATLLCAAFTFCMTACSALFEDKDVFPELDPFVAADDTAVVSQDETDTTIYISDEKVLSAEINEEGKLVVTPKRPGEAEVSFFDSEEKTYVTYEFEVTSKGEVVENPVVKVAEYKDFPASDFWFNKITDIKIEDSDILFAQIRNEGQYVRLISKVPETDDDGIYKKVSKITVTGLTEKASDAADETNPADAPETTSTAANEDTVSVFAAVDFDSVSETRIKMNAPQVLPYEKYTLEEVALESVDKASITNNKDLELVEVNKNNEIIVSVRTYQEEGISDTITIPQSAYVYTQIQRTFQTNTLPFTSNSSVNKIVLPSFSSTNTELTELISKENEIECDNTKSVTPKIENGTLLLIPGETAGDAKITISDDDGNSYTFYTETKIDDTKTPAVLQVVAYDNIKLTEETLEEDFDFDFDFEDVTSGKTKITINQPKNEGENPVIEIAEPSEDGLLFRAMHAGETSITITEEDGSKHFVNFVVAEDGTVSAKVYTLPIESLTLSNYKIEVNEDYNPERITISYSKGSGYLYPSFTVTSTKEDVAEASIVIDENGNQTVAIYTKKAGDTTITVKDIVSGLSQEISVKVIATFVERGYVVGDVLLNDGTIIYYENVAIMTADQIAAAVGVLYALDDEGNPRGWLGLYNSAGGTNIGKYKWAPSGTTGFRTKFEDIICTPSATGSGAASTATFTDNTDGSNNWAYICSQDSSGTTDAATNYPAFNYVNNYASTFNLTGDYATGWYMPSIAELCYIYRNKAVLNSVLNALGGIQLKKGEYYWSSSQDGSDYAWYVYFGNNGSIVWGKDHDLRVCCVHKFSFTDSLPNYPVSISTMTNGSVTTNKTTAHAGETVTLTVAPSTGYQLATLSVKDSSNATIITAVDPSDSTKYTFTMPDTIVSVTATFESTSPAVTYSVGDVLLNTGTIIPHANVASMTDGQKAAAVGVLYALDENDTPRGWLGLYNSAGGTNSGTYTWAPQETTGYNTKFEDIICTPSATGRGAASTATFTGDTDGSNNWAYICSQDSSGTTDAATNYSAFNYVNTYASTANLTGTAYETGWYMPSIAELCYIFRNKAVLNSVLTALEGIQLGDYTYWSSSQYNNLYNFAWGVYDEYGIVDYYYKSSLRRVCCVRAF